MNILRLSVIFYKLIVHSLTQTKFTASLSILKHCRQLTTWLNSLTLFALDQSSQNRFNIKKDLKFDKLELEHDSMALQTTNIAIIEAKTATAMLCLRIFTLFLF